MRATLSLVLAAFGFAACSDGLSGGTDAIPAVEGVVVDSAGLPIPRVSIIREGYRNAAGLEPWFGTDVDGRFRVDGMPAGEVVLRVIPGEPDIRTGELVKTSTGTLDLKIVVDPGPQLLVRIAGYVPPSGDPRHARVVWKEPDGRIATRYAPIRADGWTRFIRLPKDTDLEIWALAAPGRPVKTSALRAGDHEIRVDAVGGGEIRGTIVVSAGDSIGSVSLSATVPDHVGFRVGLVKVESDGTFVISDLPEATYRVSANIASGAVTVPVLHEVRTGSTGIVFDLRR